MARVVVVGGGFGGLATAIWLADFGHDVVLCERNDTVGGRLRGTTHQGTPIDLTPGPVTLPAVLRDLFRKTGRPLDKVLDLVPAEPAFHYRLADGRAVELPNTSRGGIARALDDALGAGSGTAWQEVIDYGGEVWSAVRSPYLTSASTRMRRYALTSGRRRRLGLDRTLRSLTGAMLPAPLGSMLEHRAAGLDPRHTPAGLAAIAYVQQTFGRWHVRGGSSRLAAALHDRATERGVTVRTSTPVTAVESSGRRVTGVRMPDGERLDTDVVVAAVDIAHLYRDLVPGIRHARRTWARSPGRFTVTLALGPQRSEPPGGGRGAYRADTPRLDPPSHTVLLSPDPDAALDAVHTAPAHPPESPTIDVYSTPDRTRVTASVVVPAHGTDVDWTAPGAADDYADRVVAALADRGLDVRGQSRWRHVHTPADTADDTGAAGGGEFGPAVTSPGDLAGRSNRTPVRGLYHVGRSAYPGPGVPLGGVSAAIVADLIGRA